MLSIQCRMLRRRKKYRYVAHVPASSANYA